LELSHRQEWILQRLRVLALLFAIEVIDFVIVDNEFYVILRNRPDLAKELSAEQVIRRWNRMSRRSLDLLPEMDSKRVKKERAKRGLVAKLRKRLSSISWLMIMLKEPIARAANAEDEVRGHFFGERFSSDELKDGEQCLATSLQINSLPVRLGLAEDLASSRFTAAFARQNGTGDWLADTVEADVAEGDAAGANASDAEVEEAEVAEVDSAGMEGADGDGAATVGADVDGVEVDGADIDGADIDGADVDGVEVDGVAESAVADRTKDASSDFAPTPARTADVDSGASLVSSDVARKPSLFHRLPLDEYMKWLASHVGPVREDAALSTPELVLPEQLPAAWVRHGFDASNWEEAVRITAPRFRWLAYAAAAMRRDCRRFTADSLPPPQ
jgi:uncharacterized protein YjbI with pentapeptide repeats